MRNETKRTRHAMVLTVALGLLTTLGTPAFAGTRSTAIQFARGTVVKDVSSPPMRDALAERRMVKQKPAWSFLPVIMTTWQSAVFGLPFATQGSGATSVDMTDGGTPF